MDETIDLIRQWREGDEAAAERLYNRHCARVFRLAYGLLGNRKDAEEVTQDALCYALQQIDRYDPGRASFTTWLHTITVSRARNRYRRQKLLSRLPTIRLGNWFHAGHDAADSRPGPEQHLVHGELWEQVQALSHHYREAIVLRYWLGLSFREMSEIIGCPLGTAQSRVRLGLEQLRHSLGSNIHPRLDMDDLDPAEQRPVAGLFSESRR